MSAGYGLNPAPVAQRDSEEIALGCFPGEHVDIGGRTGVDIGGLNDSNARDSGKLSFDEVIVTLPAKLEGLRSGKAMGAWMD